MKPWFENEAEIIKFPKPSAKVIKMPDINAYPDFITGVQDLQKTLRDDTISQQMYNKLYSDLIQKFMKKESFERPWFLRELDDKGIMSVIQARLRDPNIDTETLEKRNIWSAGSAALALLFQFARASTS